jgi:beta-phosphoglucomutase-like phosphatase (HAD superfamily)
MFNVLWKIVVYIGTLLASVTWSFQVAAPCCGVVGPRHERQNGRWKDRQQLHHERQISYISYTRPLSVPRRVASALGLGPRNEQPRGNRNSLLQQSQGNQQPRQPSQKSPPPLHYASVPACCDYSVWRLYSNSWSSPPDRDDGNGNDEDADNKPKEIGYDGLYEFLTRRTGEQAGETERQRKRDRIMEWMNSSSTGSKKGPGGASNLVQPIRLEDGKVDEILAREQEQQTPRAKAKFDQLFAGMPSLDEILSRDVVGSGASESQSTNDSNIPTRRSDTSGTSWFDLEKEQIQQEYQQILQDMKDQIQEQRELDPEGMPDNAERIAESVVQEELSRMLVSVRTARAKERLQEYEVQQMSDFNARDYTGASDAVVEQILKEASADWDRRDKVKAQENDFAEYERQRRQSYAIDAARKVAAIGSDREIENLPGESVDLDGWALERLEEMLEVSQSSNDDNGGIADILETTIEDLRRRMEKESKKGSIEPQTMKEWQMYRAIATRLGKEKALASGADIIINKGDVDEVQVARQLNSWKEYMAKEEGIRQLSGLSSGPKMPFDFLGTKGDRVAKEEASKSDKSEDRNVSRRELRREVNMQAVQAMEDLVRKSDSIRSESLRKELDALKAELEPRDYNDVEEEPVLEDAALSGPVDMSDLFGRTVDNRSTTDSTFAPSPSAKDLTGGDRMVNSEMGSPTNLDNTSGSYQQTTKQPPMTTPAFAEKKPPPPNTPFFSDKNNVEKNDLDIENKLGTVDEQKLQSMFRRAGARTKREQDSIRQEWESFQAFEKERRDQSGLSMDSNDSIVASGQNLSYDIADVITADGDIDAEKILSAIGPRPSRKMPSDMPKKDNAREMIETKVIDGSDRRNDISDALYRSVAAVGGGRGKEDEALQRKERSEFDDYLAKEDEMRMKLDQLNDTAAEVAKSIDIPIDDPGYAEVVLASIGSRPVPSRQERRVIDERALSDRGGVLASDDIDIDEDESLDDTSGDSDDNSFDDLMPQWLRKEREVAAKSRREDGSDGFSGSDIDEVFDDDKYDRNLRQLHEYEQRRSGKKQMGIDISDIFGRRGSDDYVDYTYDTDYFRERQDGWGATTFRARKENLMQYTELDISEVNNLIAYKESADTTGVSQYLPRINKPFKEFGAIFRLEGVLVSVTGLQQQVWNRVATEFDFKEPLLEDIKIASVTRPDVVVREIFSYTNDFILVRKVVDAYRRIFREEFGNWAGAQDSVVSETLTMGPSKSTPKGSLTLGFDGLEEKPAAARKDAQQTDENRRLKRLQETWNKTANQFGFPVPTYEQIVVSAVLTPDVAVRDVFRWSFDPLQVGQIVSAYSIMQAGGTSQSAELPATGRITPSNEPTPLDKTSLLELQYMAWTKVAEENSLDIPDPEEVLAASVLNDPDVVVMLGFGWTENPTRAGELALRYRDCLAELVNRRMHNRSYTTPVVEQQLEKTTLPEDLTVNGPTDSEILSSQIDAWKEASRVHNFEAPPSDRIELVMKMNSIDAVRQLLRMDYDIDDLTLQEVTETYTEALKKSSQVYLQRYNIVQETQEKSGFSTQQQSKEVSSDEVYKAAFEAWTSIAWKRGFSMPDQEQIQFAMTVGPVEAILAGFHWTDSEEEAGKIAEQYLDHIKIKRDEWLKQGYTTSIEIGTMMVEEEKLPLVRVMPGVGDWIKSLTSVEMGCSVVSYLEDDQLDALLEFAGLSHLFPKIARVSHSMGYQRDSQQLLGAALRLERRPDHCVVFDTSPYGCAAAHEVEMRSVAIVGPFPRYELMAADSSAFSVDELTAMNIRRLFGERIYDQPMLDIQSTQPETKRRVKTKYEWDDD